MKFSIKIIVIALFTCVVITPSYSAVQNSALQHISVGMAGNFGYCNAINRKGDNDYSQDICYGGGIVIEKMFSNNFGIHTGVWFNTGSIEYNISMTTVEQKAEWTFMSISMPVYLIASINASFFSLNVLFGMDVEHIFHSKMKSKSSEQGDVDILKYINYNQIGPGGGIQFKFRVSKYSDLVIGAFASLRATEISSQDDNNKANLYNYRATAGFLYRTDVFPMKE